MKICPICKFENFHRSNLCERCNCSIWYIKEESFYIDQFIVSNSNTYVIISVLIALSAFLYDPSLFNLPDASGISNQFSFIITVPLFFSIYLLFKLVLKAWSYLNFDEEKVSQNLIQIYIFALIQLMMIVGLLFILAKTNNFGGFCIITGIVGTAEFISGTKEKNLIAEIIVLSSVFTLILGFFILLSLSYIYSVLHWDWLLVYLFAYSIFISFLSAGELIGSGIYFLLEEYVKRKHKEALLNFRKKYLVFDSNTNHLKILWVVVIIIIIITGLIFIFHIIR
jgi:hypothetical protein